MFPKKIDEARVFIQVFASLFKFLRSISCYYEILEKLVTYILTLLIGRSGARDKVFKVLRPLPNC